MKHALPLVLALGLTLTASSAHAQEAPTAAPEPMLALPMGAKVRLQSQSSPGHWMKGVLVRADSASVAIV
ncbi:MAG TPA: hypothetical protein VI669_05085, partial [Vicinamibacteria bacterium]